MRKCPNNGFLENREGNTTGSHEGFQFENLGEKQLIPGICIIKHLSKQTIHLL
jgi:hypothetical protein